MQSIESIHEMSREAAEKAALQNMEPMSIWPEDIKTGQVQGIPFIGTHLPDGYSRDSLQAEYDADSHGVYMGDNDGFGAFMVDNSGFGADNEPALSARQFLDRLTPGYWAVVEAGQFQVKVGRFVKA